MRIDQHEGVVEILAVGLQEGGAEMDAETPGKLAEPRERSAMERLRAVPDRLGQQIAVRHQFRQ